MEVLLLSLRQQSVSHTHTLTITHTNILYCFLTGDNTRSQALFQGMKLAETTEYSKPFPITIQSRLGFRLP